MEEDLDLGRKLLGLELERVVGCVKEKAQLVDITPRRRVALNFIVAGFVCGDTSLFYSITWLGE